jgi:hypothetical protein
MTDAISVLHGLQVQNCKGCDVFRNYVTSLLLSVGLQSVFFDLLALSKAKQNRNQDH